MKHLFIAATFLLSASVAARAQQSEVFAPGGKAIKGYDAVAFFKQRKPVMGADSLSYDWKGAHWLFSSAENRDAFKKAPEHYAPQYGGYCAYGAAEGHKAPTQTDTWTILNDKLYFNYNSSVKQSWVKNQQALIEKADQNWPALKDKN
jgi:YHS domain-containing protein